MRYEDSMGGTLFPARLRSFTLWSGGAQALSIWKGRFRRLLGLACLSMLLLACGNASAIDKGAQ